MREAPVDKQRLVCVMGQIDPTGAAGLGRASAVVTALGLRVAPVALGVAVQTDRAVQAIVPLDTRTIAAQLRAVWRQRAPDAVFVGAMPSARIARTLRAFLAATRPRPPIVMDPALRASAGGALAVDDVRAEIVRCCPLLALLTPNAAEAAGLTGAPVRSARDARAAGRALVERGAAAVLIKGGHLEGADARDVLVTSRATRVFASARLRADARGTGCALAAAAAAGLARGESVERAVARARGVVRRELRDAAAAGTRRKRGKR